MEDLYKTLGIDKTAKTEDIKRAYRRKAKKLHPDRVGGDGAGMSDLNRAYAVLSDETRKAKYDSTGSSGTSSMADSEAQNLVMQIFSQAIQTNQPNPLQFARTTIANSISNGSQQIRHIQSQLDGLNSKRTKVRSKTKNLYLILIDQMITTGENQLKQISLQNHILGLASSILIDYEEDEVAVVSRRIYTSTI